MKHALATLITSLSFNGIFIKIPIEHQTPSKSYDLTFAFQVEEVKEMVKNG